MKTTWRFRLWAAVAFLLTAAAVGHADEAIHLRPSPPIAKGDAAFPRAVAAPGDKAIARINAVLASADQGASCDGEGGPNSTWSRTTFSTMRGPRYLSLLAYNEWYCGGPYPGTDQETFVFDLGKGAPIDWKGIFKAGVVASESVQGGAATVTSPVLWKLYAAAASADLKDKECEQVLADPTAIGVDLTLWPDAEADALEVMQADFPHVVQACGPPESLSLAELRRLGVDAAFLADLDEAHRRGWYDKSEN